MRAPAGRRVGISSGRGEMGERGRKERGRGKEECLDKGGEWGKREKIGTKGGNGRKNGEKAGARGIRGNKR